MSEIKNENIPGTWYSCWLNYIKTFNIIIINPGIIYYFNFIHIKLQPSATVPFHKHKCRKHFPRNLFWAIAQRACCDKCPHRSSENNLMFLQKVSLQALWEHHSYKPCCGRFPTSLVGLAYNSKSCPPTRTPSNQSSNC